MKKIIVCVLIGIGIYCMCSCSDVEQTRSYNQKYTGKYTSRVAFPIGGLGTGMFCIEGSGAISNMNIRHRTEMLNEPTMFAGLYLKDIENGSIVIEGQVPDWKKFGQPQSTKGYGGTWGLPRFKDCDFEAKFPFANLSMHDDELKVDVSMQVWNPFIPTDEDNSGLPVAGFEYTFKNKYDKEVEAIFSYNSKNFLDIRRGGAPIKSIKNGFIISQNGIEGEPFHQADFAIFTDEPDTKVNHCWFRGWSFDSFTMCWNEMSSGQMKENPANMPDAPGASLYVPFKLKPGESKTIRLYMAWYVPYSPIREGLEPDTDIDTPDAPVLNEKGEPANYIDASIQLSDKYRPWYSNRFANVEEIADYWVKNYKSLKEKTELFTNAFYSTTLPDEVIEAVSANLTILKSPTIFRQYDGRMWNWEGCGNEYGSCYGSCTHVWNYAQAIPHLFPRMERTMRETEFFVSQAKNGHQAFRSALPIRPIRHNFHAAADGQLGGIMKVYRDWHIYGNDEWLKLIYPYAKSSLDYCIDTWDPKRAGVIEEPHHNTYDIEFWGPSGMINSYYTGALQALVAMGEYLGKEVVEYKELMNKSISYMESQLYDGEYFIQNIRWKELQASDPTKVQSVNSNYSKEGLELLEQEGPKYQYGKGCLSDGIVGSWLSLACGLNEAIDRQKITSHLLSVHKYNLKRNLRKHVNPQRSTFALGDEGGLLLCSWPKGGKLQLPFVYSNEVWTGIEYQVASHLMFEGEVEKGLDIVRICRDRYDGRVRNPFNEYECGAWYARALSSYAMLQALTGVRYDAVDSTLYIDSKIGNNFTSFLSTETGFGNVGLKEGKPFIEVKYGKIDVKKCFVSDKEADIINK
ncbi:GH116 family glycosyl hydrolase [Bacteroides sp.]|uniref:GH116 family glycosyl hydrolase n=1 Tax=Bacteroides sp. TaxID=29523 RepID=UPI00262A101F|nr:GH116 family glycosyl hydrolase [Bacteroides sp.]